jgi:hypothetical protein
MGEKFKLKRRYTIWNVHLVKKTESKLVFISTMFRYLMVLLFIWLIIVAGDFWEMVWKRDILSLISCLFILATALLLPFTDEFSFDKQEGIFQWVRESLASRLRIIKPKQKLYLLEDLDITWKNILGTGYLIVSTFTNEQFYLNIVGEMANFQALMSWMNEE